MRLPHTFSRWLTRLCLATLAFCAALYIINIFWTITLYTHTQTYGIWSGRGIIGIVYPPSVRLEKPIWTRLSPGPGLTTERNEMPLRLLPKYGYMRPWPARYAIIPLWLLMLPGVGWLLALCIIHRPRPGFWGWALLLLLCATAAALLASARSPRYMVMGKRAVQLRSGGLLLRWFDPTQSNSPPPAPVPSAQPLAISWDDAISPYVYPAPRSRDDSDFIWFFSHLAESGDVTLRLPLWILLPVLAVPAVVIWRNAILRCGPGRCIKCGYDLSGLPAPADPSASPRCPKCGHQRAQSHQPPPTSQPHPAPH